VEERFRPEIRQSVGAIFRASRELLGLSQHQVVQLTTERGHHVSRSALCDIERGCNLPGIESLVALCEVLQIDPRVILERIGRRGEPPLDLLQGTIEEIDRKAMLLFWAGQSRVACTVYSALAERLESDPSYEPLARRRLRARFAICRSFALKNCGSLQAAESAAKQGLHCAIVAGDYRQQVEALIILASLHMAEGLFPLGEVETEKALTLAQAEGSTRVLGLAWGARALALYRSGRIEEAMEPFVRSRDLLAKTGEHGNLAKLEGNIGACLSKLGHRAAARRQFNRALTLCRKFHDPAGEALWQIAIGQLAFLMDELDEAEARLAAGLRIARGIDPPLTLFRGVWLQHQVAKRRNSKASDRHRLAHLKRLYPRVASHSGVDAVQEFRQQVLGMSDA
jgi:tetratricopeptide (TPR) repeat protein